MDRLTDKVIVVTGASSGIGKAIVEEAFLKGMRVVLAARNIDAMQAIVDETDHDPDDYLIVQTNVSNKDDCRFLIEKTIDKFGQVDVLVNNAGISMRALFEHTELTVLESLMQVNFWGAVYCTHYAFPWLLKSGGTVVGVSSIAGYKGLPARTGYSASKFALQGFLESLRIENRKNGLHVLIACPGFTASNIRKTALAGDGSAQGESPRDEKAMMPAKEVACQIIKAIEKKKHRLVLTKQGKLTVLLNKLFPAFVDALVYKHMASEPDSPFS